jgi:hypothetical protein
MRETRGKQYRKACLRSCASRRSGCRTPTRSQWKP